MNSPEVDACVMNNDSLDTRYELYITSVFRIGGPHMPELNIWVFR